MSLWSTLSAGTSLVADDGRNGNELPNAPARRCQTRATLNPRDLIEGRRPVGDVFCPMKSEACSDTAQTESLKASYRLVWRFPTRRV